MSTSMRLPLTAKDWTSRRHASDA